MKKVLIALIGVIVLVAVLAIGNIAMQKATADKADALIERFMEDTYYDWEYERAYLNPITKTLYIEGFLLDDELFARHVKISSLREEDESLTANVALQGVDVTRSRQRYVRIDKLKIDDLMLVLDDYEEWWPGGFSGIGMKNFRMRDSEIRVSIGSADVKGDMTVPSSIFGFSSLLSNLDSNVKVTDLSVDLEDMEPVVIKSIMSVSKVSGEKYTQTLSVDAGTLFTMKGSVNGLIATMDTTEDRYDDADNFGDIQISDFSIDYEDKSLLDTLIKMMEEKNGRKGLREDMLEELEYEDFSRILEGDVFVSLVQDFISNPGHVVLTGKAVDGPVSIMNVMYDGGAAFPDQMEIMLTVNANAPFQIRMNPDYSYWGDEDYVYTMGGMVVDFVDYDEQEGACSFVSYYEGGDVYFYCSEADARFFADREGPFYIEYDDNYDITYRTEDAEGYEDWEDEYSEDYGDDDYGGDNGGLAGGLYLNYIGADYDPEYNNYSCSFTSHTDGAQYTFYCDESDVAYFEEREGPFYVEFDYYDTITGYSENWNDYGEWIAEDY